MSLIIVCKCDSDQDQQRNDRENNDPHDGKCQQCDIEFVILELLQILYKRIDMFSALCFFLKPVNSHFILSQITRNVNQITNETMEKQQDHKTSCR